MTDAQKQRAKAICKDIADDMKNDAAWFDGQPFTGKTVGTCFGNHGAAITALANIVAEMLIEPPQEPTP